MSNANELKEILVELAKPFAPNEIKQREGFRDKTGKVHMLRYVDWKTVADRLDAVYPTWGYSCSQPQAMGEYVAVSALITIEGVSREGIGTGPNTPDGTKKAESDALKRAAAKFGIGRDLYSDNHDDNQDDAPRFSAPRQAQPAPQKEFKPVAVEDVKNPTAANEGELASPKQLAAIRAICKAQGIDPEEECDELFDCSLSELNKKAASALIDRLKAS